MKNMLNKLLIRITDEVGSKSAYEANDGLYQHYIKLFVAGTRDFPRDHTDDLKLQMNATLNKNPEGSRC